MNMDRSSYHDRLRKCEIPSGSNWNERYKAALFAFQLEMADEPSHPDDVMAPLPVPNEPDGWGKAQFIVDKA